MTEKLPKTFTGTGEVKGFLFNQLEETSQAYLYEVIDNGRKHFEVFVKKVVPLCVDFENRVYSETEFKESYPKSGVFGLYAWTYNEMEKAKEKLNEISV